ncbi:MAG: hypothetical protein GXO60_02475 [Epsilonproteobacteria bacterium]|nr:hypothetical protein [Campylobacterota bacterium]
MSKLLDIDINKQLLEVMGQFGLEFEKNGDYYFANNSFPGITALAFEMERFENSVIVQVDIHLLFPNQSFIESFIGHAESVEEAVAEAFEQFEVNVLHTLIASFWEDAKRVENGVGTDIWEINGHRWQIVVSNYGYRGMEPFDNIIEDSDMLYDEIEKAIKSMPLEKDIYAIRTLYTNLGNGRSVTEALINNEQFPELERAVSALPWKNVGSQYSVRNLVIAMKLED